MKLLTTLQDHEQIYRLYSLIPEFLIFSFISPEKTLHKDPRLRSQLLRKIADFRFYPALELLQKAMLNKLETNAIRLQARACYNDLFVAKSERGL